MTGHAFLQASRLKRLRNDDAGYANSLAIQGLVHGVQSIYVGFKPNLHHISLQPLILSWLVTLSLEQPYKQSLIQLVNLYRPSYRPFNLFLILEILNGSLRRLFDISLSPILHHL
jgi:hypothetical protein